MMIKSNAIFFIQFLKQNCPSFSIILVFMLLLNGCATDEFYFYEALRNNTINGYESYLRHYPKSQYAKRSQNALENLEFEVAKSKNTVESYEDFLMKYHFSKRIPEIKVKLSVIKLLEKGPIYTSELEKVNLILERVRFQDFRIAEEQLRSLEANEPYTAPFDEVLMNLRIFLDDEKRLNIQRLKELAKASKKFLGLNKYGQQSKIILRGKAVVWDSESDKPEMAYGLLADEYKASPHDEIVTMFLIGKREKLLIGSYSLSRQPGYMETVTVCAIYFSDIYWPEGRYAGTFKFEKGIPAERQYSPFPEYAKVDIVDIINWIQSLPRE